MPLRLAVGVDHGEQLVGQLSGALVIAGERRGLRRMFEQPRTIGPGGRLGVWDLGPELERPPEVEVRLPGCVGDLGRPPRSHRSGERLGDAVGGVPMVGELGSRDSRIIPERQLRVGGQGDRHALVERAALAGEQVTVHGLVSEGVPELVAVMPRDEELMADRVPQGPVHRPRVDAGDLAEQRVSDASADDRGDLQQLSGIGADPVDALQDHVANSRRKVVAATCRHQLLGEERVAVGSGDDLFAEPAGGIDTQDLPDQLGDLSVAERSQRQSLGAPGPNELAEGRRQPATAAVFVRSSGSDHEDAGGRRGVGEEEQQVACRLVGPVEILDDNARRAGPPPVRSTDRRPTGRSESDRAVRRRWVAARPPAPRRAAGRGSSPSVRTARHLRTGGSSRGGRGCPPVRRGPRTRR